MPNCVEQVLGHAGPFQHQTHECKKWNCEQGIVAHHAVDALGKRLQEVGRELAKLDADQSENQTDRAERKSCRIAEQQKYHQRHEHDRRHVLDKERCHSKLRPAVRLVFFDGFDDVLDFGLEGVDLCCVRVRNEVAHDRDTLDQFGQSLKKQKRESDHDE